ncbi:MAG: alpha/beta hydrolase [archaeon]
MVKRQLLLIHGGMTFRRKKDYVQYLKTRKIAVMKKRKWSGEYLDKKLGKDFKIIRPRMPLCENAKYADWKIHFERHIPFLRNNVVLLGRSLGGIFLAKYLSENKFPKKLAAVYLICPSFDRTHSVETLTGGFTLRSDLSLIGKNCKKLHLFFSADDVIVPPYHAEQYRKKLPWASITVFESKNGHFSVETFSELVRLLKKDLN